MKKICYYAISLLFVSFPFLNIAVSQEIKTYPSDETVITATKQETKPEHVPQPVTIISQQQIQDSPAYNAGEMLDFVPGVRIISNGGIGAQQGISVRSLNGGMGSNKSLILLDGRPVNDAWTGGVNFNSIPIELVDRVEVVRGPGSALYGSQATGGVINVITKRPSPGFHGWLSLGTEISSSEDIADKSADGYGRPDVGASKVGLNGSFGGEKASHLLSLGYKQANQSYTLAKDDDWNNYDLFYKGNYDITEKVNTALTLDIHNDIWKYYSSATPNESVSDVIAADFGVGYQTGRGKLNGRIYLNHVDSEIKIYSTDLKTGQSANRLGVMADYSVPLGEESTFIAGLDGIFDSADIDYKKTVINMKSLGIGTVNYRDNNTGTVTQVQADTFEGVYGSSSQNYSENNIALFAQYTRNMFRKLNLVLGGRLDMQSEFGTVFNPKAGLTYDLPGKDTFLTTLKVSYGTAFRSPPMVDLFSQDLTGYGNKDIKPEKTKNIDAGIFQRFGSFGHAELTIYRMEVKDLMISDQIGSTGNGYHVFIQNGAPIDTLRFNQRKNLGSYSPKGIELAFRVNPHSQISLIGRYNYLDPGDFTFQTSKTRYNAGISGFIPLGENRIEAETLYRYTGDGYFFDYETNPFDAFGTTDVRASFEYRENYKISMFIKNIFDEKYKLWHYAWQPGRTLLISFESRF